jgi:two-component system chemotaxis response regulator CheY
VASPIFSTTGNLIMKKNISEYKVLVADDHMISIRLLQTHLQVAGFAAIDIATNGEEVDEQMAAHRYDIVFIDWAMPFKDGLSIVKECRADPAYANTAFVMVSAEAQSHSIIEAIEAGATAYLVKPLSQNELKETVTKVLAWLDSRPDSAGTGAHG